MVVLHVKSAAYASSPSPPDASDATEFLYECATSAAVTDVAAALDALAGLQARLLSLCCRLRDRCADASSAGELERALDEAEAYASKEQVQHSRFLSPRVLREHIKNIEKKCATTLQESPEIWCPQQSGNVNLDNIEVSFNAKKIQVEDVKLQEKTMIALQYFCSYI